MIRHVLIDPDLVYTEGDIVLTLDMPSATLSRARRLGELRFCRRGRRVYYRGQWILDWLTGGVHADVPEVQPCHS